MPTDFAAGLAVHSLMQSASTGCWRHPHDRASTFVALTDAGQGDHRIYASLRSRTPNGATWYTLPVLRWAPVRDSGCLQRPVPACRRNA